MLRFFFYSLLRPFQDYFSSYEPVQSVGGSKMDEPPRKSTWHTHKQNLACVAFAHVGLNPHQTQLFFFLIQFYVPFKLFHSYRDESIGRWGENRSTRGKTT